MVADRLLPHYQFNLPDAIQLDYDTRANQRIGTDYKIYAPTFAEKLGLRYEMSGNVEAMRRCLRTGSAAVVLVAGNREGHIGLFTKSGHYITVI